MNKKIYLGDSVYAEFDGYGVTLTTENGDGPSNTIYVEPQIMAALDRFWKREIELSKAEVTGGGRDAV